MTRADTIEIAERPRITLDRTLLRTWRKGSWVWGLGAVLGEYLSMAVAIGIALTWSHPLTWVLAVIWVGARQHALLVLMHEAAHYNLLPSRRWNDLLAEVLLAWPFFISMFAYRHEHWAHHRHLNTDKDPDWHRTHAHDAPDWVTPMALGRLVWILARDLLGFDAVQQIRDIRNNQGDQSAPKSPMPGWIQPVFYLVLLAVLIATGTWWIALVFWILPAMTWLKMVLRLRYLAEHFSVNGGDGTRTTIPSLIGRALVAPWNVSYHSEHHLYPGVPARHLPALHAHLKAQGGIEHDQWIETDGFDGVIAELTTRNDLTP